MSEVGQEVKPGERFRYLREQYAPHREKAGEIIRKSGLDPKKMRGLRAKVAKELYRTGAEGERDELTGILNHRGFMRRLREEAARVKRSESGGILVLLDANNLKQVNDTQGHDAGDQLLRTIAQSLQEATRITDVVARYGGDEFGVFLVGTDPKGAQEWWKRLNSLFELKEVRISAGATDLNPDDIHNSIRITDDTLYRAKRLSGGDKKNHFIYL